METKKARETLKRFLIIWILQNVMRQIHADNFTIGYLYSDKSKGFIKNKQGRIISGAMTYAVTLINMNDNLLAGHTLKFEKADTWADTLIGTKRLTELWRAGAVAFIGPEDSCNVEARVAAAWNLPMLSYVSIVFVRSPFHPHPSRNTSIQKFRTTSFPGVPFKLACLDREEFEAHRMFSAKSVAKAKALALMLLLIMPKNRLHSSPQKLLVEYQKLHGQKVKVIKQKRVINRDLDICAQTKVLEAMENVKLKESLWCHQLVLRTKCWKIEKKNPNNNGKVFFCFRFQGIWTSGCCFRGKPIEKQMHWIWKQIFSLEIDQPLPTM